MNPYSLMYKGYLCHTYLALSIQSQESLSLLGTLLTHCLSLLLKHKARITYGEQCLQYRYSCNTIDPY